MKKVLFIVYTPFQLINSLNIINDLEDSYITDICFMHYNLEKYKVQVLNKIKGDIFCPRELYDATPNYGSFRNHFAVLKNIIRKKRFFRNNKLFSNRYDTLFVPSDDSSCRVIYKALKKRCTISLSLFDDGVGTYSGYIYKKRMLISRVLYGLLLEEKFYEYVSDVYCYCPDLFNKNPYHYNIKKIVYKNQNFVFEPALSDAIGQYIGKKAIFLDQGISTNDNIKKSLRILEEVFGREAIIVKKHPRVNGLDIYGEIACSKDGLPFEALATSLNCEGCLVVAHSSTACVMPYLLSGVNYHIVTLFSLGCNVSDDNLFKRINAVSGCELVYMPNSLEELSTYLNNNKSRIHQISQ